MPPSLDPRNRSHRDRTRAEGCDASAGAHRKRLAKATAANKAAAAAGRTLDRRDLRLVAPFHIAETREYVGSTVVIAGA